MAAQSGASGGTGTAPLSLHGAGGEDYQAQEKLEHRFLGAARRLPFNFKFNLTFPPVTQAKNFKWAQMMEMLETHPNLINCTTSKLRWTALMQASYVAR